MALTTVQLTGRLLRADGATPAVGSIEFRLSTALRDPAGNVVVEAAPIVVELDAAGAFSQALVVTDDPLLHPTADVAYRVTERLEGLGRPRSYYLPLPRALTPEADLADLVPAEVGPPVVYYATRDEFAGHVDGDGAHAASAVSFDPAGTALAATDVQAAVVELDVEKSPVHGHPYEPAGALAVHTQDDVAAHQAAAVAFDPAGTALAATHVQGALVELDAAYPRLAGAAPLPLVGTAAAGAAATAARADHQHPDSGLGVLASARTWTATQTYQPGAVDQVPLVIVGLAGQTADLQQWQDSTGAVRSRVSPGFGVIGETVTASRALGGAVVINGDPGRVKEIRLQTGAVNRWRLLASSTAEAGGNTGSDLQVLAHSDAGATIGTALTIERSTMNAGWWGSSYGGAQRAMFLGNALVEPTSLPVGGGLLYVGEGTLKYQGTAGVPTQLGPALVVTAASASAVPATVAGAAGQTGDLQRWQDSAATVLARITSVGALTLSGTGGAVTTSAHSTFKADGAISSVVVTADGAGASSTATVLRVLAGAAGQVGGVVRGAASQTGDLQQWQNSASGVLVKVTAAGGLRTDDGIGVSTDPNAGIGVYIRSGRANPLWVEPTLASAVPIVVRAHASQTGDLQQWQNSAGTALLKVVSTGYLADSNLDSLLLRTTSSPNNRMRALTASHTVLVLQGAASQTGDLQQWQDSAGNLLARVDSAGRATVPRVVVSGDGFMEIRGSAGGVRDLRFSTDTSLRWVVRLGTTAETGGDAGSDFVISSRTDTGAAKTSFLQLERATDNVGWWGTSFGGGARVMYVGNATTAPTSNPTAGGLLYVESGVFKYRGSGGGVATIGPNLLGVAASAAGTPLVARAVASQTGSLQRWENSAGVALAAVNPAGLHEWVAANEQLTVGAAGVAAPPPATPSKWLKVRDSGGTTLVIPAYAAA